MNEKADTPKKEEEKKERWTPKQYETIAKWTKEVALLVFASMVVQEIVISRSIAAPLVFIGGLASLGLYITALRLLSKS